MRIRDSLPGLFLAAVMGTSTTINAGQSAEQIAQRMISSGQAQDHAELASVFDRLEAVDADFMLGVWRGGKFDGGKGPDPINWFGKRFVSRDQVDPLLVHAPNATVTVFRKLGDARLREVRFRGKTSASLIYDKQPIMDYFRRVSDDTVIGWGEVKGKDEVLFFYLTRAPDTKVVEETELK